VSAAIARAERIARRRHDCSSITNHILAAAGADAVIPAWLTADHDVVGITTATLNTTTVLLSPPPAAHKELDECRPFRRRPINS